MKKLTTALLLAAHLLGLVPLPALAAYPTQDNPAYTPEGSLNWQSSRVPKAKRIMVVIPSRLAGIIDATADAANEYNGVYHALDMAREQGADVHIYNSRLFENASLYPGGRRLWSEAGDYYALAIVLSCRSFGGAGREYLMNGDSTNVQILVVGGTQTNGAITWGADTLARGFFDASRSNLETASGTTFAGLLPWTSTGLGTDTIWANNLPTGVAMLDSSGYWSRANTGLRVRRILHPFVAGGSSYSWCSLAANGTFGTDTLTTAGNTNTMRKPGAAAGTPNIAGTPDSIVQSREMLGPLWKVIFPPSAYNADSSQVWWLKYNTSTTYNVHNPGLLWACIARFVDVAPIKWAYDWDDVTDVNDSNNYPRWRNSAAESTLARLRSFGVVPSNGINPTNAPGYIGGTTPTGESGVAWVGPAHTYLKGLNWIHHAHDSTNGRIGSNLVGGYGGYAPSNGPYPNGNQQTGSRYASRYQPGTSYGWTNFGIVQRLAYDDSVRKAWSPQSYRPPYLTFPSNQMLPVNWKTRGAAAGYTAPYTVTTADCPIDSVLWAFDYGLLGQQSSGKGQIWLRSGLVNGLKKEALWADRDSFVAATIGMYPRDRWTVRVGSRLIEANIHHSILQGASKTARATYIANVNFRVGHLLGLNNRTQKAEMNRPNYSETYDSDKNKLMNNSIGHVNFPARQSTRILYQHPGQLTDAITTSGDIHVDTFLTGIHSYIRAMDDIAGRKVSVCVPAWQVYAKK